MAALPPLRYLSSGDVRAAMPPLEERLRLAELTMTALGNDAELPPKVAVHPRPEASFAHAMPAYLRASGPAGATDGGDDGLGMKWVAGFPTNIPAGLPGIHALILLNDPRTGVPTAILDGGPVTAERTAAVSGVAIRRLAPARAGRPVRVGLVGTGVQGRSHLPVLGSLLPGCTIAVFSGDPARAAAFAADARAVPGIGGAEGAPSVREAVAGADLVVTAAAFGPVRQVVPNDWLMPDALVVAVDYATTVAAEVARGAALFAVDERGQFLANREAGLFEGYPDPPLTLGEAIRGGVERPAEGRVLVTHLGVGLADVVFGRAIVERAASLGLGIELPR